MKKNFTKLVVLAITATMLTAPLAAQIPTKAEMQIGRIEQRSAALPDYRTNKPKVQLRANSKAFPEYSINYTPSGEKSSKEVYEYDASGNQTSYIIYNWKNNNWINAYKYVAEYDAVGNVTIGISSSWENNRWIDTYKTVMENGIQFSYRWENNRWGTPEISYYHLFKDRASLVIHDGKLVFGYPERTDWISYFIFIGDEINTYDAKYDSYGNLTYFKPSPNSSHFEIKYNNNNNPVSIESKTDGETWWKINYEYNQDCKLTVYDAYSWIGEKWVVSRNKYVYDYDVQGNVILRETYNGNVENNTWILDSKYEYIYKYDLNGNIIFEEGSTGYKYYYKNDGYGNLIAQYYYWLVDNTWKLYDYTIWYPNSSTPDAEAENNTPVGNNNQGGFDLNVNISLDSISNGSLVVTFPEGFTLDAANTSLTLDFAGNFELKITKQENNSWLLEIKPKTTRNASLRADEAKNMLHIAYKVDDKKPRGTYDISVNSILFETKGGNYIPEPAITLQSTVDRWGVDNELIHSLSPTVYISNQTIYIQSENAEQISIYSITGRKLYETAIKAGMNTINTFNFPQGIYIVKGSNGWVRKLIAK